MNYDNKEILLAIKSKWIIFISIIFITTPICYSQKGASPITIPNNSASEIHNTYAVVVGISDYQSPQIPDLQYADKDAVAFANWLRSPAGGKVKDKNIILMVNDSATTGRFIDALTWLRDQCNESDQAIIYFSGHGDVESKLRDQLGFLLCYDSPPRNYAAGSCAINYLQSVISTISLDKKSKVLVITDACHAGKLAGSKINGSGITNANLALQFANEVKILSCQQNEFALEGKEWGNGRGVFSWVLIDGLNGMADVNDDKTINLLEIGRYLEERVSGLTAPHQQIPITVGDRMASITHVDDNYKQEIHKEKSKDVTAFFPTNMRGLETGFISDSIIEKKYKQFLSAIETHQLMHPKDVCANDLYESLKNEKEIAPLYNLMRRNLAIALQDEVQQALNALLDDDPYEINNWNNHPEKYNEYPIYISRAMELLGEKHYIYNSLKSKKIYFETSMLERNHVNFKSKDSLLNLLKANYKEAINLDPNAAYLYHSIANLYFGRTPCATDSLIYWNTKAMEIAPSWLTPIFETGMEYLYCENNACESEPWIEKAYKERPNTYMAQLYLSWLRQWQGRIEESKQMNLQMIEQKPKLFNAYSTLAMTLGKIEGDYKQANSYILKFWALDSSLSVISEQIGDIANNSGDFKFLIKLFNDPKYKMWVEKDPTCTSYLAEAYYYLKEYNHGLECLNKLFNLKIGAATYYHVRMKFWEGRIYLAQGNLKAAKKCFLDMFDMENTHDGLFVWAYAWLAECSLLENNITEAESYFQKAINYRYCGDGMDTPEPREEAYYLYGRFLIDQNRMNEAKEQMDKAIDVRRMGYWGEYGMAIYYAHINSKDEALSYLKQALDHSFPFFEKINSESAFTEIKQTFEFKHLIKEYAKK